MVRDRIDPLVEGGVEFGNDVLLPLLPHEPEQRLRLVDRVLANAMRSPTARCEPLVRPPHYDVGPTYDGPEGKRKNLVQADIAVEKGDGRRLPRGLLEGLFRIGMRPILVVAF